MTHALPLMGLVLQTDSSDGVNFDVTASVVTSVQTGLSVNVVGCSSSAYSDAAMAVLNTMMDTSPFAFRLFFLPLVRATETHW